MEAATDERRTCYRHRDRETGVSCSSCGNPICPDCMTPTPVGMRCPECARQKTQVRKPQSMSSAVPVLTQVIMAICVIAWCAELATENRGTEAVIFKGGLAAFFVGEQDEWYRIVTAGFLHDDRMPMGLLHIGFNMYLLYMLGQMLEPTLGRLRFALVYVVSLLGGSLGALLLSPDKLTIGASGAVFGLMAVALVELRSRGIPPMQTPLGGLLIVNLAITFGFAGSISVGGHLGGLAAGGVAGLLIYEVGRSRRLRTAVTLGCAGFGVALFAGAILVAQNPVT